jgi:hypothetical protein
MERRCDMLNAPEVRLVMSQIKSNTKHLSMPYPKHTHPYAVCGVLLDIYLLDTVENTEKKTPCSRCLAQKRKEMSSLALQILQASKDINLLKKGNNDG